MSSLSQTGLRTFPTDIISFSLRDKRAQIQLAASERDEQTTRASRALEFTRPNTLRRADVVRQERAVGDVLEGLEHLRKKNEASTSRISPSLVIPNHHVSSQQGSEYKQYKDHSVHAG